MNWIITFPDSKPFQGFPLISKDQTLECHKRGIQAHLHLAFIFHFIHSYQIEMQPEWRISFPQRSHTRFYIWDIRCDPQSASNTSDDKSHCPNLTPITYGNTFCWLMVSDIHITGFTSPVNCFRKISQFRVGGLLSLQLSLFNSIACLLWQTASRFSVGRNITFLFPVVFLEPSTIIGAWKILVELIRMKTECLNKWTDFGVLGIFPHNSIRSKLCHLGTI